MWPDFEQILCSYCFNSKCPVSLIIDIFNNTCAIHFYLTILHLIVTTVFAYLTGRLPVLDDLDRRIRATRRPVESRLLIVQSICLLICIVAFVFDFKHNYYSLLGLDSAGVVYFIFKTGSYVCIGIFTIQTFTHFDSSFARTVISQILIIFVLAGLGLQTVWLYERIGSIELHSFQFAFLFAQIVTLLAYSIVGLLSYLSNRRHSLYYESFADNQNTFGTLQSTSGSDQFMLPKHFSLWSQLIFAWTSPLFKKAIRNRLKDVSDIFPLPRSLTTLHVTEKLIKICSDNQFTFDHIPLLKVLWKCFWKQMLVLALLRFLSDGLSFCSPIIMHELLVYVDNKKATNDGFIFAFAIVCSQIASTLAITHFDLQSFRVGIQMRAGTLSLLQQKILITGFDRLMENVGSGKLMTLTGVDTDRLMNICSTLLQCISQPAQILLSLFLLYRQLGVGSMAGVILAIVLLPINKLVCDLISKLTAKQLKHKDARVKATSQLLANVRVIRANLIQNVLRKKIEKERQAEVELLRKRKYLDAVCVFLWATTPLLVSLATFSTCTWLGQKLDTASVFTSVVLLNMLVVPLNSLPWVLQSIVECLVSLRRLQAVFNLKSNCQLPQALQVISHDLNELRRSPDVENGNRQKIDQMAVRIRKKSDVDNFNMVASDRSVHIFLRNLTLKRDLLNETGQMFTIGPLNLKITQGMFVGVIGPTGCGKSSFLQALVGEFQTIDPKSMMAIQKNTLETGLGYVPQQPWIQNMSIRNNILFGRNFQYRFYNDVLDACALRPDLANYEEYDLKVVGDRGASLSGGQKARIALARAVYQDLQLYLMDEPYAALDVHVADYIHDRILKTMLKGRTRIVCTHLHRYLQEADLIVQLEQGKVIAVGKPEDVLQSSSPNFEQTLEHSSEANESQASKSINLNSKIDGEHKEEEFVEEKGIGYVSIRIYLKYAKSIGSILCVIIFLFFIAMQSTRSFSDFWLSVWVNGLTNPNANVQFYLKVLEIIVAVNSVLAIFRAYTFAYGGIVAAKKWHQQLLDSVLKTKLSFFDQRPFGQLINRFSSDIYEVDEVLPFTLNIFLANCFGLIASVVIVTFGIWPMLFVFVLLATPYIRIQFIYRAASSSLKRICATTLSPIYSLLSETLEGLTTIRCFKAEKRFGSLLNDRIDMNHAAQYSLQACSQWLVLRLQLLALLVSSTAALVAALQHHVNWLHIPSGEAGLALSYALGLCTLLNGTLHVFTQLEMNLVSIERLGSYIEHDQHESNEGQTPEDFPLDGKIVFNNLSLKYLSKQTHALNDINFVIKPREYMGIVGRTGAGKSTLLHVLLRLYEPTSGHIEIDGYKTSNLNLATLRSSIFVISQDGCLFDDTIRANLDPEQRLEDHELWKAVEKCGVRPIIAKLGGLDSLVGDQGNSLSSGERQIVGLIRAFIQKSKIICMDEATSSIDKETEMVLQNTLRKAFRNSTVILIAHRLQSVLNCDRILVMDQGRVVEIDSPDKLIQDPKSMFFKMWSTNEHKLN